MFDQDIARHSFGNRAGIRPRARRVVAVEAAGMGGMGWVVEYPSASIEARGVADKLKLSKGTEGTSPDDAKRRHGQSARYATRWTRAV